MTDMVVAHNRLKRVAMKNAETLRMHQPSGGAMRRSQDRLGGIGKRVFGALCAFVAIGDQQQAGVCRSKLGNGA